MKIRILFFGVVFGLILSANFAMALTYNWTGAGSNSSWNNSANWQATTSGGTFPSANDIVQIGVANTFTNQPTADGAPSCAKLVFGPLTNTILTIGNLVTLNVGGTVSFTGSATINATTTSNLTATDISITAGTINFGSGLSINLSGNSTIASGSTLNSSANINLVGHQMGAPTKFTNAGNVNLSGGTVTIGIKQSLINNSGATIVLNSTTFLLNSTTVTGQITNNGTFTSTTSTFTLSGATAIIANTGTFTDTGSAFTFSSTSTMTNSGTNASMIFHGSTIKTNSVAGASGTFITNSATLTADQATSITVATTSIISNTTGGTFNLTGISGTPCTLTLSGASSSFSNTGTFAGSFSTFGLSGSSTTIQNTGTYSDNGSTYTITGGGSSFIQNAGTPGSMHFVGSTISASGSANSNVINNSGTFLAEGNSNITISSTAAITNSGTFSSGTSNSAGNISLTGTSAAITNTGTFNLGSTSIINPSGTSASITNTSPGVFTLQSDVNGSASISALGSGASCNGSFSVQRYITGDINNNSYRGYRLLSSPVNAGVQVNSAPVYTINSLLNNMYVLGITGTAGGFSGTGNPNIFLFDEALVPNGGSFNSVNFMGISKINNPNLYDYYINGWNIVYNIPIGNGVMVYYRGSSKQELYNMATLPGANASNDTLTMTGNLNQGTISPHNWYNPTSQYLGYTGTGNGSNTNAAVRGFNLVGNPYPSSINWDLADSTNSSAAIYAPKISPFIYVYDAYTQHYNVYGYGLNGVGTFGPNSNIIPSGQGFFVLARDTTAQLIFTEAAKTSSQATAANGNLYLGKPVQQQVAQYIRLSLGKDDINRDGTLICFKSTATASYNSTQDAVYRAGTGTVGLSTTSADNYALAINSLPLPNQTPLQIPLNVSATVDGAYKLHLATVKSIPDLYDIWLMDAYLKDSTDLRKNPVYNVDITNSIAATHGSGRFTLVIRQNTAKGVKLINFAATKVSGGSQVSWTTINEQNYTYFTVERTTDGGASFTVLNGITSSALGTYSYLDKNPAAGANGYRLKVVDLNGTVSYSQVVTLNYSNTPASNNIVVYPNPVAGTINLSIVQNSGLTINQPSFTIQVVNILGTVVKNGKTKTFAWQENANNLSPGTYVIQVVNASNNSLVGKTTFIKL